MKKSFILVAGIIVSTLMTSCSVDDEITAGETPETNYYEVKNDDGGGTGVGLIPIKPPKPPTKP